MKSFKKDASKLIMSAKIQNKSKFGLRKFLNIKILNKTMKGWKQFLKRMKYSNWLIYERTCLILVIKKFSFHIKIQCPYEKKNSWTLKCVSNKNIKKLSVIEKTKWFLVLFKNFSLKKTLKNALYDAYYCVFGSI